MAVRASGRGGAAGRCGWAVSGLSGGQDGVEGVLRAGGVVAIARRAAAFGMDVQAVDRDPVAPSPEVERVLGPDDFDGLLETSDVVAICCPLTPETRGKFNAAAFARMQSSAYLVNVTRGEVMVEEDLAEALEAGGIAGAALDVAPREPLPPDSRLWSLPNVVMTPHTAGASQFRAPRNIDRFVGNIRRFLDGERLAGVIDKELGY